MRRSFAGNNVSEVSIQIFSAQCANEDTNTFEKTDHLFPKSMQIIFRELGQLLMSSQAHESPSHH
ncbi:hypothetical protein EBR25_01365 [bacterium]|nr:hypothetical protein [bacterium]